MPNLQCGECSAIYTTESKLKTHTDNFHSLSCTYIDTVYYRDKFTDEFECQSGSCEYKTKSRQNMQNHLRRKHKNAQPPASGKKDHRSSPYPQARCSDSSLSHARRRAGGSSILSEPPTQFKLASDSFRSC